MTRIEQYANPQHSDSERCSGPEKDLRVLLMVQDGTTPDRWRAFGRWSVPAEVITQAWERWNPTGSGSILFLRVSALPDGDGGNGSIAVFWDIPVGHPMPAWHLIGLEAGRTYSVILGLLCSANVFQIVADPMVFIAPTLRSRSPAPASRNTGAPEIRRRPGKRCHV